MARNDVRLIDTSGRTIPTLTWEVAAQSSPPLIKAGEPVKFNSVGSSRYVILAATSEPTTSALWIGIAAADSTETASADGTVDVYTPQDGVVYEVKAKTAANANTAALISALKTKRVTLDLTSSTFTFNESGADSATNGAMIIGGDPNRSMIYFIFMNDSVLWGL